jgi:hypothetical protein
MVSEDNLAYMRQKGARYLVGTPKSMLNPSSAVCVYFGLKRVASAAER